MASFGASCRQRRGRAVPRPDRADPHALDAAERGNHGGAALASQQFWLVLATGFHDGMSGKDQRQAFVDRMDSVDPLMSDTAYARMKQMGELAYNRELAGRAQAWISAHPTQSLGIAQIGRAHV